MFLISDISYCYLQIPFTEKFSHAAATRTHTESIWVTVSTQDGLVGYGEGCPRRYVSGETLESAAEFVDVIRDEVTQSINSLASLQQWVQENNDIIDTNPAAWSAIELALLDVIARQRGESIEQVLGIPCSCNVFRYSAVLGNNQLKTFAKQALVYAQLGFRDFKVKLSGVLSEDRNKLDLLQCMHEEPVRIRLDANNLWYNGKDAVDYIQALQMPLVAIEEPIKKDQYSQLRSVARELHVPIILDESFQRVRQFAHIEYDTGSWIINLRVSKMGGLLRSLEVIRQARLLHIPIIVGAHVGETSLMTRASMVVARAANDILLAQEGGFGTYLLKRDVCDTPLMFGKQGEIRIENGLVPPVGFGLEIVQENIYLSIPMV